MKKREILKYTDRNWKLHLTNEKCDDFALIEAASVQRQRRCRERKKAAYFSHVK